MTKTIVAVDMDNTVGDFTGGLRDYLRERDGLTVEQAMALYPEPDDYDFAGWFDSKDDFLTAFHAAEEDGIYRKMKAYDGSIRALERLVSRQDTDVKIVTARDARWNDETREFLSRYGFDHSLEIFNVSKKQDFEAHIFIDDKDSFIEDLRSNPRYTSDGVLKTVVVPSRGYNQHLRPVRSWSTISGIVNRKINILQAR